MRLLTHQLGWLLLLALAAAPLGAQETDTPFKAEEIEQLVAPIALYPDSLLAQVLMASTYPLEVVEAARWVENNPDVKDKALEEAMQKQSWDESVKSLTAFPPVIKMMDEKLDWTQKLGDAFLAQQSDLMDAVQRLRAKAKSEGNLESNEQQKVSVEPAPPPPANVEQNVNVEQAPASDTVIIVEPADPQVVYVPSYNPTVVYGAWPYPAYPPYYYYPPGYVASSMISFGVGMAVGSALWGGCSWGWGHSDVDIDINRYNEFNRTDISNREWNHKAEHRKGVQYRDQKTQQRYGRDNRQAAASRDQFRGRAEQGRQDLARGGADRYKRDAGTRDSVAARDRQRQAGDAGTRDSVAARDRQRQNSGAGTRDSVGARDRQRQAGGAGTRDARPAQRQSQTSRQPSRQRDSGAFQGVGNSSSQARRNSNRGASSRRSAANSGFGGRGGGGRGGGGFGGGRGGGGGRRGGRR